MSRPDAIKVPFLFDHKAYPGRAGDITALVDEILKPDKANGEYAWVRRNEREYFVSRDRDSGEFHAVDSGRKYEPRYTWEPMKGRPEILVGRLKDDAKPRENEKGAGNAA